MKTRTSVVLFAVGALLGSAACGVTSQDAQDEAQSSNGEALINTGGGTGGTSFTCNEPDAPGMCYCEPPETSQDCQDMKKNCRDDILCGWLVTKCSCHMAARARPPSRLPHPPVAGRR